MTSLLSAVDLSRNWGEMVLFDHISFELVQGTKTALVARNGTGKTTLLDTLAGKQSPDTGEVNLYKDTVLGYLPQVPSFDGELSVMETVYHTSGNLLGVIKAYENALLSDDKVRLGKAMEEMDRNDAWNYENRVKEILSRLNIQNLEQKVKELSGGQRKRLALACVLIDEPDLLILDEPTNHLDLDMIEWLEIYLSKSDITLFMVTHDRFFLDRVCDHILELDGGNVYNYDGNYSYFVEKREERIQNMLNERDRARNLLKKEQEWMRRMPKARGTKAKYRIDAFYDLKDKAQQIISEQDVQLVAGSARMGKKILELKKLNKSYGDLVLLDEFSYQFQRGEKLGIIGGNGVGKSTLLNVITEQIAPDSGEIETGETIVFGYFRQDNFNLDMQKTVLEVITDIAERIEIGKDQVLSPLQFLNFFLFPPAMHHVKVEKLSGGEQRRLFLMTVLMQNPNFLILDEPTNDLDIQTLGVLENYLVQFQGCVIVVSHDRFFMDNIVDHLFVFEGQGVIKDFAGNYSQYREFTTEQEKEIKKAEAVEVKPKPKAQEGINKRKLSYKEKVEYEKLPEEIEQLENEKSTLETEMNSGTLSPDELTVHGTRIGEIIELLDEKEMRWLELSEIAEG